MDSLECVFFKSDRLPPIPVRSTADGKIDFGELGLRFRLKPDSITLGGRCFPKVGLKSEASWKQIKNALGVDGTREDPVIVEASEVPTGLPAPIANPPESDESEAIREVAAKKLKTSNNNVLEDIKLVIERSIAESVTSTFTPVLDKFKALMVEQSLATRAASQINSEDLSSLRSTLGILGPIPEVDGYPPDMGVVDLEKLLTAEGDASEAFWDQRYELQRQNDYIAELKKCIPPRRNFIWKSATSTKLRKTSTDGDFRVSACNDVVLCPTRYNSVCELGAILGVEVKRKLTRQGLRQAEVEFYMWADQSMFPYVQLITDMQRGGVVFFYRARYVHMMAFGSMECVKAFLRRLVNSLPFDLGQNSVDGGIVRPDSLSEPHRNKFSPMDLKLSSSGHQHGGRPASAEMALWSLAARFQNNLHDVGNIRDLDDFDLADEIQ